MNALLPTTMKAAVVPELGAPLVVRDLPVPAPGPGQVLMRMQTCGICHTDIHAARGDSVLAGKVPARLVLEFW